MLTTFYPPWSFGGDAVQVQRLARELVARGHEVTVVHSREAYRALARRAPDMPEEDDGVTRVPIDAGVGFLSPLATYLTGRPLLAHGQLARRLEEEFDVLHFHNPSLLGGPALLSMGSGIKLYTLHEQWLVCPTHVLWKYRRRVCEEPHCWRCELTYRRPPQPWRSSGLMARSVASLDALIAPSRTSAGLHARFSDVVRIERIPHFVADPEREPSGASKPSRSPPREASNRPYFLFVGRHESIKGVEKAIDAFRRRGSEDLLIAGTGPLTTSLEPAAADLPHVRFLGWCDSDQLDALYRGALAVIVPTLGHEAFGLVPVEACARGTPSIVHGFGALAELVEESGAGFTYASDTDLDAALDRIATDPALRARLGERGRQTYLRWWTPEAHLRRYLGLVEDLAETRGDARLAEIARAAKPSEAIPA
jgi:glycosyltransferase involved in cell wall biosynthesis